MRKERRREGKKQGLMGIFQPAELWAAFDFPIHLEYEIANLLIESFGKISSPECSWKTTFVTLEFRDCRFSNSLYRFFFSSQFLCFLYVSQHLHLHNINSENGLTILSSSGCEGLVSGSPYTWDTGQHYRLFRGHKFQREFS